MYSLPQILLLCSADDSIDASMDFNLSEDNAEFLKDMDLIESLTKELSFRKAPRLSVYLDIDQTLIYSADPNPDYFDFRLDASGIIYYVKKRPHLQSFLDFLTANCDVFIFTSAVSSYAEEMVDHLNLRHVVKKIYSRKNCFGDNYIKDLKSVDADLSRSVLIDDTAAAINRQYCNSIMVKPFNGDICDKELLRVQAMLENVLNDRDIRPKLKAYWSGELLI